MEELLKEFLQIVGLIAGTSYTSVVCVKYISGPFDKNIFDPRIFDTGGHTVNKKNLGGIPFAILAIIAYFL